MPPVNSSVGRDKRTLSSFPSLKGKGEEGMGKKEDEIRGGNDRLVGIDTRREKKDGREGEGGEVVTMG